jgi:transcriptional regulator with XRE-family HTH domain
MKKKRNNQRSTGDLDAEIGQRIRLLRVERGLSQEGVGQHLGVSFQQVQKYEKGTNRLSAARLTELAKLLKTTPNDLMAWDSKVSVTPIDIETYKLAKAFSSLKSEWQGPVRLLINSLMRVP